jgi:DNA-binding CsgD family transcriptional regulator
MLPAKTAIVDKNKKSTLDSNYATGEALTAIEGEILKLVVEGKSNAKVAALLGLSPRTVETYRARLMRKLGVDNLPDLVKYAIRHGITPLD